ncbi:DASH complex subunit dam1 [Elasticomyces elasticus]|nr:DASH complex subunit dam1 [Elasticomyces elasticus]
MADLEANLMHLSLLNESLGRFNECFGSFLYGMQASAFCVDFPEAPIPDSFKRTRAHQPVEAQHTRSDRHPRDSHNTNTINDNNDPEATFLYAPPQPPFFHHQRPTILTRPTRTSDTSFIENPPTSSRPASRFTGPSAPIPPGRMGSLRGGASSAAGRGARGGAAAGGTTRAGSSGRARGGARAPR